jgi:hypothetical protein
MSQESPRQGKGDEYRARGFLLGHRFQRTSQPDLDRGVDIVASSDNSAIILFSSQERQEIHSLSGSAKPGRLAAATEYSSSGPKHLLSFQPPWPSSLS